MDEKTQVHRLTALRAELKAEGIAAYLVPHADAFQNEYLVPADERLKWISGFSGSAGFAVVTTTRAVVFVDGRYTLQVQTQCPKKHWEHLHIAKDSLELWLQTHLKSGDKIGFDPHLHTPGGLAPLQMALKEQGLVLQASSDNLIDRIWENRPDPPAGLVVQHPLEFSGETSIQKRQRIATVLSEQGMDALVITAPDNLAWMLNIRGSDIDMTPVALGFCILQSDGSASLFMDEEKISPPVRAGLESESITVQDGDQFETALIKLGEKSVRVDGATANIHSVEILKQARAKVDIGIDPCTSDKACKNQVELQGMIHAHVRDGVALARFFHWFSKADLAGQSEWTSAEKIDGLRAQGQYFKSLSFPTISATAENGAIVHYQLQKDQARTFQQDELYLLDSGAQYLDGTTDVTRVLLTGRPTDEMILRYTQVLKGHIAASTARFAKGTVGAEIDPLARQFLVADGVDYDHGTGHGVGCYLSVHEGPQSLSKRGTNASLKPGMVLSIEPGYYKAGAYGIRIENLVYVSQNKTDPAMGKDQDLGFETLTLAPYERRLIDVSMLTDQDRDWIDGYHMRVRNVLTPFLEDDVAAFLAQETEPLAG